MVCSRVRRRSRSWCADLLFSAPAPPTYPHYAMRLPIHSSFSTARRDLTSAPFTWPKYKQSCFLDCAPQMPVAAFTATVAPPTNQGYDVSRQYFSDRRPSELRRKLRSVSTGPTAILRRLQNPFQNNVPVMSHAASLSSTSTRLGIGIYGAWIVLHTASYTSLQFSLY